MNPARFLLFVGLPVAAVCADEPMTWRKVAELQAPTGTSYRAVINIGRNDWRAALPFKVEIGAEAVASLNGHAVVVTNGLAVLPAAAFIGRDDNVLDVTFRAQPPTRTLPLYCTFTAVKGPRLSVDDFFARCLDASVPALAQARDLAAKGDVAGAQKVFAAHVRATVRPHATIGEWLDRTLSKNAREALRRRAAEVMDYTFNPIGAFHFPERRIPWEFNPTWNGYCEWCFHLSYLDFGSTLAEEYLAGHDPAVARTWRDQIESFFTDEPVPLPPAGAGCTKPWRSLETGVRMFHLPRQLCAFLDSDVMDDAFVTMFYRSLWEHGNRLRHFHAPGGNWLTQEMSGLVRLTLFCPFFAESAAWHAYAIGRMEKELSNQVYPDGFQIELATGYHGGVIRHFVSVIEAERQYGKEPPAALLAGIERMYNLYTHLARPDRGIPGLNDSGDFDCGPKLKQGFELFPKRTDFAYFAFDEKKGAPPPFLSVAMPWAGALVLRDGWERDAAWAYMDASPFGYAHQHEDKLNVLIHARGRKLLTEGGFYDYDTSEMRQYVLSTRSHNTVRIDGRDQNRRRDYRWQAEDATRRAEFRFAAGEDRDVARAVYDEGYAGRTGRGVRHDRTLILHKGAAGRPPVFVVVDRLTATDGQPHAYEQLWHLEESRYSSEGLTFASDFDGVTLHGAFAGGADAKLVNLSGISEPELQGWKPVLKKGPHPHIPIPTPTLCGTFTGGVRLVAVFSPVAPGENAVRAVDASSAVSSRDYTLVSADGTRRTFEETPVPPIQGESK